MPKLTGVFEQFSSFDQISLENVSHSLSFKMEINNLTNYLGNRILYPQTIPLSAQEMETDLSLLKEAVRINPQVVYNKDKGGIVITQEFEIRFKPLSKLIETLIEALTLESVTAVFSKTETGNTPIGSIVKIVTAAATTPVILDGQVYQVKKGSLVVLPSLSKTAQLTVDQKVLAVIGGRAGVFIDARGVK